MGGDDAALAAVREQLVAEIGPEAFVDATAVVANFERMVRIAGATLDISIATLATGLREELDLDRFGSAGNTPRAGVVQRVIGRVLGPFAGVVMRPMGRCMRRGDRKAGGAG